MEQKKTLAKRITSFHSTHFSFVDRVGFGEILTFWMSFVILCGLAYYFLSSENSYLFSMVDNLKITTFLNSLYFSVVASTTTGFGDIIPRGLFKVLSSFEVLISIMVVAIVTSKLISLKQDAILEELYEITFSERINRLRSSLLVFRQQVNTLIHKQEDGVLKQRDLKQTYVLVAGFKETIKEINTLFKKQNKDFLKQITANDISLITNSILHSFQRLCVLMNLLSNSKVDWSSSKLMFFLDRSIAVEEDYFRLVRKSGLLSKNEYADFEIERNKVIKKLMTYVDSDKIEPL